VFCSVFDLQAAINRFLDEHNAEPKPFIWTADPDKIIAAVKRGHQVLDSIHQGSSAWVAKGANTFCAETDFCSPQRMLGIMAETDNRSTEVLRNR
jgi:hypothetical protein